MRTSRTALLTTLAVLSLASACGAEPEPVAATTTPTPTPVAAPFPGGTQQQDGDGTARSGLVLRDVRVKDRDGFDRLVLTFRGTGTPGWTAGYVDEAVVEGSGKVVRLAGDSTLDLYASATSPTPELYDGPRRLQLDSDGALAEVYLVGTREGYTQVFVGVDGDAVPFRVTTRESPTRLMLDLAD